ncbi:MAG: twin-arginine translocation signal domain-containing protein, partial [Tardiphaga sp.]
MTDRTSTETLNRRRFLSAAGLAGAGAALSGIPARAEAAKPEPLITEVQDW